MKVVQIILPPILILILFHSLSNGETDIRRQKYSPFRHFPILPLLILASQPFKAWKPGFLKLDEKSRWACAYMVLDGLLILRSGYQSIDRAEFSESVLN
jgi:hypothetical protein